MKKFTLNTKQVLAFEMLEREMELIAREEQIECVGGIQRDGNGNIIYTADHTGVEYFYGSQGIVSGVVEYGYILADNGAHIQVMKNISAPAGADTDCHGVTFGDGLYWINNDQVNDILSGDSYSSNSFIPYVGDVVVYYDENGNVVHTATVSSTDGTINGTQVYGQGGMEEYNNNTSLAYAYPEYSSYLIVSKGSTGNF